MKQYPATALAKNAKEMMKFVAATGPHTAVTGLAISASSGIATLAA